MLQGLPHFTVTSGWLPHMYGIVETQLLLCCSEAWLLLMESEK